MLPGAGLRDNPRLAHPPGQQNLPHAVVDLMRPGMVQLIALEVDFGAAQLARQPLGEPHRTRPPDIMF
jgi:hypothetical protein